MMYLKNYFFNWNLLFVYSFCLVEAKPVKSEMIKDVEEIIIKSLPSIRLSDCTDNKPNIAVTIAMKSVTKENLIILNTSF